MSGMIEVARATVTIIPNMEGAQGQITQQLAGPCSAAGNYAGGVLGASMAGALNKSGALMTKTGKFLSLAVTAPLVAVGAAGVKSFAQVDQTMALTNKTMGNTEEQAKLLSDAMKSAAANSTFGMNDAANATLNFARAGLSAEQAAAALAPTMNLAAGEGGNLEVVSAGLVGTINAFHGSFDDASHYADIFAAACNNSALDVNSLASAMSVAAPIFSSAGYEVQDAALFMGVMANNSIDANVAANSLKTGLARLVDPANEGAEVLEKLGISVTNADGSMKDSVVIQQELHDAFSELSESEQLAAASAIFGKNQMAPWLALINTAPADVAELNTAMSESAGLTNEMAEAMMSGSGGSMKKLKSSIDVAKTSLGEALAPTISKVADVIQGLIDKFNALSPEQQGMVAKIGLAVAAAGPLLMVTGKLTTGAGKVLGVIGKLGGMTKTAGSAIGGLGKAVGGAGGAVGSLGSGLAAALPGVLSFAIGALAVGAAIRIAGPYLRDFGAAIAEVVTAVGAGVSQIIATLGVALPPIIESVATGVQGIVVCVSGGIVEIVGAIAGGVSGILDSVSGVITAIGDSVESVGAGISSVVDSIAGGIAEVVTAIGDSTTNVLGGVAGIFDSMGTAALNAGEGFRNLASGVIELVNNTGAMDLAATMTAVATGVKDVNKAAADSGSAASELNSMAAALSGVTGKSSSAVTAAAQKISAAMSMAKTAVQDGVNAMRSAWATADFKPPHIPLPHFTVIAGEMPYGAFGQGYAPSYSVDWYAAAAEKAAAFRSPTIIGVGDASQTELLTGEQTLRQNIKDAVAEAGAGGVPVNLYIGTFKVNTDEYVDEAVLNFIEALLDKGKMFA